MTDHLTWDTLNDLADGLLAPDLRMRADAHVAACPECRESLKALRVIVASVAALPPDIDPPDTLWADVRATIDARKVAPLPAAAHSPARGWWITPRRLAVAAVALIAVTSLTTVAVMRPGSALLAPGGAPVLVPASWEAAERGYLSNVDALRAQLDLQRDRLGAETIGTVERSLATIDGAIAEARAALVRDPANAALTELLASNYRQKVELLRRATQLNPAT